MAEELRCCPFCGGEAHIDSDYSSELDHTFWRVWHDCDTNPGPVRHTYGHALGMEISTPWCASEDAAVDLWNRRAERTCRVVSAKECGGVGYAPGCSECGWQMADSMWHNYCPNCGARVIGEETDNAD